MVMKKEWYYVIALVAIIILIMIVFRDEIMLAPKNSKSNSRADLVSPTKSEITENLERVFGENNLENMGLANLKRKAGVK